MSWRVLNMADVSAFPEAIDALRRVAEVVSLPAKLAEYLAAEAS
jgi:hypothetical protein